MSRHEGVHAPWVALGILGFSLVAEGCSLAFALGKINRLRRGKSLWRWFIDTRRSKLMVVLGEDSAALVGLSLAATAVLATMVTGNPLFDALGSILVGVLLVVVAAALGYEIKGLLIGQSAGPLTRQAIQEFLAGRQEIAQVVELITLQQGDDIFVVARAELLRDFSFGEAAAVVECCKREVRSAFPAIAWVFIEPTPPRESQCLTLADNPRS